MFKPIRLVKKVPNLDFFRFHKLCFALSAFLCLGSVLSLATLGLNFGVDFAGGVLIEVRSQGPADLGQMRDKIGNLNLGDVALQEKAEMAAVAAVREVLGAGYEYRRVEVVGPKVGAELVTGGILAVTLSLAGIMAYMALRFGWRAGLAGVVAILHDCLTTVGFFSITQLQFDLNVLAAVVTIAGFSINDTVVIDDRIRENLRKYKAMPFRQLINRSVNETMARTVVTNGLVFLAVFALLLLGGPVLFGFAVAMTWGVVLGTYSTVYVAAPLEWYLAGKDTHSAHRDDDEAPAAAKP